jgi:hypothetical protein
MLRTLMSQLRQSVYRIFNIYTNTRIFLFKRLILLDEKDDFSTSIKKNAKKHAPPHRTLRETNRNKSKLRASASLRERNATPPHQSK